MRIACQLNLLLHGTNCWELRFQLLADCSLKLRVLNCVSVHARLPCIRYGIFKQMCNHPQEICT